MLRRKKAITDAIAINLYKRDLATCFLRSHSHLLVPMIV